jgi:hypothetical protein
MPLSMGVGLTDDYFVVGQTDSGAPGVQLLAGQVALVTSADPATVVITPDTTVRATTVPFTLADGTAVPAGTACLASGKVGSPAVPAQPSVPITITVHLANTDGSPILDDTGAAIADLTDTVTIVPGLLKKDGVLFGTPTPPASAKRA